MALNFADTPIYLVSVYIVKKPSLVIPGFILLAGISVESYEDIIDQKYFDLLDGIVAPFCCKRCSLLFRQ
jgi:hypothetical protein